MQALAMVLFMVFLCLEINKLRHEWETILLLLCYLLLLFNCK